MFISGALPSETPCGNTVIYPIKIDSMNIQEKKSIIFMIHCFESAKSYLVKPRPRNGSRVGLEYIKEGDPNTIANEYAKLPWPEFEINDDNGTFTYKVAPSDEERDSFFKQRN
ncbi:hypothetical protein OQZ55_11555 [Bacillus subtilis]|uniref:hypothetical protein n=1 Tax=Bacillus subtilis group TaxID=653685 RepID=UPI0002884E59|nr:MULTISPECIES: hypothetical protein [Bacillus subtilis group]WIT28124.1 hypothetical protein [Bacillus phage SPbetaL8]MBG9768289.1 hypothetical protein [Bacillus vallismortis]MCT6513294.1 hypothetical protein [Bacillus subtilis]MCX4076833.1 hypothetical protein [Bacillus subtilis]MDE5154293.1 hypothetical protein [Bacillus amyloliquefaciens]